MRHVLLAALFAYLLSSFALAETSAEIAIEEAYYSWVDATNAKDIDRWSSFLAKDVLFLPPDSAVLDTEDKIRRYYIQLFSDRNFSLDCRQLSARISSSGNMAWTTGVCRATFTGADGDLVHGASKWAKVWAKQSDDDWKCQLNIWNANPAAY